MPTDAIHIREASISDAAAIARVHVESSEDAYAPLVEEWNAPGVAERTRMWKGWLTAARSDPSRTDLVAVVGGEVGAFVTAGPSRRDDVNADVEVYVIHVLPGLRGNGVGSRLWTEVCARSRGEGLLPMYVETFAELRCCSFYKARGGEASQSMPWSFQGSDVTRVVYQWRAGKASG